ncbi:hypothetical protein GCM10023115_41460 [Pontixanthobacter gangjinensis]|uniref:Uncharacterized protein n=1 Tax=Christiangramia aestuarii TaxID=1028746 RepID=A0A7K1LRT9_9FLAO|nr:hypothetical protein [Christiangramia aestuarii]MUP43468.1 hypothetical protein [Christiangramia aestuarii]
MMAESLGYDSTLHYGSMNYDNSKLNEEIDSIYSEYKFQIENDLSFPEQRLFNKKLDRLYADDLKVLMGGPVQTLLTGILGLIILGYRKASIEENGMTLLDWIAVFLSLFWLREVFNLVHSFLVGIFYKQPDFFGGDERYISEYYGLYPGTLPIILGILGLLITLFVIFRILPKALQIPFIVSGLIGGISGYIIWFHVVGPFLLP